MRVSDSCIEDEKTCKELLKIKNIRKINAMERIGEIPISTRFWNVREFSRYPKSLKKMQVFEHFQNFLNQLNIQKCWEAFRALKNIEKLKF